MAESGFCLCSPKAVSGRLAPHIKRQLPGTVAASRSRPIPVAQDRPLSGESHLSQPVQRVSKATATPVEDKGVGFSQTSRRQLEATVEADLEQCNVRSSTRRPRGSADVVTRDLNRWLERNKHLAQDIMQRQRSPKPHDSRQR